MQNTGWGVAASQFDSLPPEAANDTLLQKLLSGDMGSVGNAHSRADWYLLMKLMHWTGDDRQLVKALFLNSPLGSVQKSKMRKATADAAVRAMLREPLTAFSRSVETHR